MYRLYNCLLLQHREEQLEREKEQRMLDIDLGDVFGDLDLPPLTVSSSSDPAPPQPPPPSSIDDVKTSKFDYFDPPKPPDLSNVSSLLTSSSDQIHSVESSMRLPFKAGVYILRLLPRPPWHNTFNLQEA